MRLYQRMARVAGAYRHCVENNNRKWKDTHIDTLNKLVVDYLPHGSGLDGIWRIDSKRSNEERLVLYMDYHVMDEKFHDRWIDFTVTVTPSLGFGFDLNIRGNFGKYQNVKDSLYEVIQEALDQEIE